MRSRASSGTFDREIYRFALRQQGWSEAEFEAALRRDVARSRLQGAVIGRLCRPAAGWSIRFTARSPSGGRSR